MEVLHINVGCGNTCRVLRPNRNPYFFSGDAPLKIYIDIIFAIFESRDTYSFRPIIVGIYYLFLKFQDYFSTKKLSESNHPKSRRLEKMTASPSGSVKKPEVSNFVFFFRGSSIHQYIHGLVQKFPRILLLLDPVFFSLDPYI